MIKFIKSMFMVDNGASLLDAGIRGIDAMVFTDEERSKANAQLLTTFIELQKATQAQNVARRYLAFGVALIWATLVVLISTTSVVASLSGLEQLAAATASLVTVMKEFVFIPFSGIMAFYFLTHLARGIPSK